MENANEQQNDDASDAQRTELVGWWLVRSWSCRDSVQNPFHWIDVDGGGASGGPYVNVDGGHGRPAKQRRLSGPASAAAYSKGLTVL